jgi:hypothetical protein
MVSSVILGSAVSNQSYEGLGARRQPVAAGRGSKSSTTLRAK